MIVIICILNFSFRVKKHIVNLHVEIIYSLYCSQSLSGVQLFVTPWTVAHQAPLSAGFHRQEYWSEWPFSTSGDLPDPGTKPGSPVLAGRFFTTEPPGKPIIFQSPSPTVPRGLLQSFSAPYCFSFQQCPHPLSTEARVLQGSVTKQRIFTKQ